MEERKTRRDYLKFVGGLAAGLVVGGVAAWLSKPTTIVEKTITMEKTITQTIAPTVSPAVTQTVTVTATAPQELPWIGDYLSAPWDPGWTQWPRKNPPYRLGITVPWTGNPWRRMQAVETNVFLKALKEAGWVEDWRVLDAGGDVLEQKRNIQELIEWGCDAMIIDPVRGEALIEDIERVTDMGIFTGLCVEAPDPYPYGKLKKFGTIHQTNYYKSGYLQAKFVAETLIRKHPREKRKVCVLRGIPGAPSAIQRWEGAVHALEEYKDQGVQYIGIDTEWSIPKTREMVADVIARDPNFRGFISQGGGIAAMVPLAFEEAGLDPSEIVVTEEDFVIIIKEQRQYKFDLLIVCNPQTQQLYLIWEMIKCLHGMPARKINYFDPPIFTPEQLYKAYEDIFDELPDYAMLMTPLNPEQLKAFLRE